MNEDWDEVGIQNSGSLIDDVLSSAHTSIDNR